MKGAGNRSEVDLASMTFRISAVLDFTPANVGRYAVMYTAVFVTLRIWFGGRSFSISEVVARCGDIVVDGFIPHSVSAVELPGSRTKPPSHLT